MAFCTIFKVNKCASNATNTCTIGESNVTNAYTIGEARSAARSIRKVMNKDNNSISDVQQIAGEKPHKIKIKVGGDIDGCYDGKNA